MTALSKHSNVKIFSEKLLLLLNRGGEGARNLCGAASLSWDSMIPSNSLQWLWPSHSDSPDPSSLPPAS